MELARTVFEIALSNAVIALVLLLLALLVRRVANRPALVNGLCLLALIKLITPPLVHLPILPAPAPVPVAPIDASPELLAALVALAPTAPGIDWTALLLFTLLAGSTVVLLVGWRRGRRFRRLLAATRPAPAPLVAQVGALARRLNLTRVPPIRLVAARVSPMLCPVGGTPHLVLPEALLTELDDQSRSSLLLHELAHVQRRDYWVRHIERVVLALYWWLPVAWWLRRVLREAEEQCCDAWVVWALPGGAHVRGHVAPHR